ncbi:hypothetical protein [Kitasatospora sp. NPDC056184]|uniref:hypothetical protein n=1 Tax=Kitasatospora sp. NPDC056184 TaxID=3345738 RepID=UPI0035E097B3
MTSARRRGDAPRGRRGELASRAGRPTTVDVGWGTTLAPLSGPAAFGLFRALLSLFRD